MQRLSSETLHEKIEAQHIIIERLRADNKQLTASALELLDQMSELQEENKALEAQAQARNAVIVECKLLIGELGEALDDRGDHYRQQLIKRANDQIT